MPAAPRVGWGWHRLTESWADTIVADAHVQRGELVLDVGAGRGVLTEPLARAGARVVAIELHPRRVEELQRRFAHGAVRVVRADAANLRLPRQPFRIVANPPFAVTTSLLRRVLAPGSRLVAADIVLQRAAARRWLEGRAPGAGRWLRTFEVLPGRLIPRAAFIPRPPVDCIVLSIRRR